MNINKFTQNSLQAVQNCEKIAADNGNQELAQEHLLYALLTQDDSLILKLLEKMSIQSQLFVNRVEQAIGKRTKVQGGKAYVCLLYTSKNGKSGDCDQFPGQVIFNTCSIIICSSRLCSVSAAL